MAKLKINWQHVPLYTLLFMFCWPWLIKLGLVAHTSNTLYWFIAVVYLNYMSFVLSIAKGHRLKDGIDPVQAVWLFVLSNILLVLTFATGWQMFDVYGTSAGCTNNTNFLDSLYFSLTIFATVGFGDFLPCNADGKALFIAESLIGSTHFGIFITLIFSRVIFPTAEKA
ncbi:potassium channel family protein [Chitinibacter sp. SCUT-21]|uniref:potassium channel family protein n=1 Tax=Chitinibacter sp. SCUT-21 TaxID=2970891 RepID=UPI0035A5E2CF